MRYKVIALSCGGLRNRIFESGDIVTEKNFKEGRAAELVKQGFLEPILEDGESSETSEETSPSGTPSGVEGAELNLDADDFGTSGSDDPAESANKIEDSSTEGSETLNDGDDARAPGEENTAADSSENATTEVKIPGIEEVTTTLLKNELKENQISFNKNASKDELYQLWVALKEKK